MEREKEKREAARKYATHNVDTDETDFYGNYVKKEDFVLLEYNAFLEGCKWSDKNPKSPWINVKDDLPCNHSDLVLTYNDTPFLTKRVIVATDIHTLFLCEMKKDNDRGWIWNYSTKDKITHWFPIPELPKE